MSFGWGIIDKVHRADQIWVHGDYQISRLVMPLEWSSQYTMKSRIIGTL